MTPVIILLCIESALAAIAFVASGRRLAPMALWLICASAPLEVYRTPVAGVNLSLFRLSVLVGAATLLWDARGQVTAFARHRLVGGYLALALIMSISILTLSQNRFLSARVLSQVLIGIVVIIVICGLTTRTSLETAVRGVVVGVVVPIAAASVQAGLLLAGVRTSLPLLDQLPVASGLENSRLTYAFAGEQGLRARGTFGDANHFGVYLAVVLGLALALGALHLVRKQGRPAIAVLSLAVASAGMLVATDSRTAWIAAACGVAGVAWPTAAILRGGWTRRRRLIALGAALVVSLGVALPLASRILARVQPNTGINAVSNQVHVHTMSVALHQFVEHPVFGIGLSDLGGHLGQNMRASNAHSSWLDVAAELGAIGVLALLALVAVVIGPLVGLVRRMLGTRYALIPGGLLGAYAGFATASAFYDLWWDDFHWMLLGVVLAAIRLLPGWAAPAWMRLRLPPGRLRWRRPAPARS